MRNHQASEVEDEPRPFEPWRRARTDRARALVAEVEQAVQDYEQAVGRRQRARKAKDQTTFSATIAALTCDLAHLHLCRSSGDVQRIAITRNRNLLSSGPARYRSLPMNKCLPAVLDLMEAVRLLDQRLGDRSVYRHVFTDRLGELRQRQPTSIAPGPHLVRLIDHYGLTFSDLEVADAGELIILKEPKLDHWHTPIGIDYHDTSRTNGYRDELRQINHWQAAADITLVERWPGELAHIDVGDRRLRRIFTNGSFDSGGRLAGGFWTSMKKELRLGCLRISGERVASLDFNSMYPRLCYARAEVAAPDGDLYAFYGTDRKYRDGMKRLFNARLFDRGKRTRKPKRTPKEVREGKVLYPPDMTIGDLLNCIEAAHPAIKHLFGTGIGHRLQHTESTILISALRKAMRLGIVVLPVHDCVVCARSASPVVREIMEEATREATAWRLPIEIETID